MKVVMQAVELKSGNSFLVRGMHMDTKGEVTHISVEPNKDGTTWEPVQDFMLVALTVETDGGRTL